MNSTKGKNLQPIFASNNLTNYGHPRQGHSTATILSNKGRQLTVLSDESYKQKSRNRRPVLPNKGSRSMHRTTMVFESNPKLKGGYDTTVTQSYTGSRSDPRPRVPDQYPSLHTSHFDIGMNNRFYSDTQNRQEFYQKETIPHDTLHWPIIENKFHMNDAKKMKDVLTREDNNLNYWTQYSRMHGYLGTRLGPGVERERNVRKQFNIFTGEYTDTPAWKENNKRTSGNRVLYDARRDTQGAHNMFVLG